LMRNHILIASKFNLSVTIWNTCFSGSFALCTVELTTTDAASTLSEKIA